VRKQARVRATSNRRDNRRTRSDGPEQDGDLRDDAALVEAVRAGDAAAFDRLVGRYMRRAFTVAVRVTGHRQDAEDLVQEAFLAALLKIDTFEPQRPFGPWLLRIVVNRGINFCKARALRRAESIPVTAPSRDGSPFDATQQRELRDELQRALATLPDRQRWIIELFELDGFTSPEIAEMLEMAEGTVRWHLHQARQALRATLDRQALRA
jgi:RNA polymerase sigma-70 factor, ECF subfamily